ncbi:sodium/potassium/calcium exchanger 3-like [Chrysoperla carnea]|uniref:sodium/potassium/calcium exchanger 3-like n=1 Tax=Chrysoperla carnea TaxID=189513 RepID=UPI001D090A0D|nr:sodium/potassium/calcium exchanger 3-like [Chrysoperla carnea]
METHITSSLATVLNNCTLEDAEDMPPDYFTQNQRLHGAILLHIFAGIYSFTLLAVVCNDFFLASVECIIKKLNLSEDIGAATFMSVATSAPEFFVNFIGVFISKSDVGIGTIVGSSAFNLLGVGALGGLTAIKPISIERWPVTRDCVIYAICVSALVAVIWDYKIYWYEAMILVIMYIAYFIFMFSNKCILKRLKPLLRKFSSKPAENETSSQVSVVKIIDPKKEFLRTISTLSFNSNKGVPPKIEFNFMDYGLFRYYDHDADESLGSTSTVRKLSYLTDDSLLPEEEYIGICKPPSKGGPWLLVWWIYTWPIRLVLTCTLPDCRKYPKVFPLTFLMCIFWIGVNSYIVTWMMSIIGTTFEIPSVIMGLTFLAAGGCLPEAISIIIMSRKGFGGMGVSNALGANTMDILMCLGLIWFIKALQNEMNGLEYFPIKSGGIRYTIICILIGIFILYTTFLTNDFKLCKRVGIILILAYLLFITSAIISMTYFASIGEC